jgi:small subunit ribosomal protein S18
VPRDRGSKSGGPKGKGPRDRDGKGGKQGFLRRGRPKVCHFCKEKIAYVDYKDTSMLRRFVSDRGKIRARRVTGTCQRHQRDIALAVKNAREMGLMAYTVR